MGVIFKIIWSSTFNINQIIKVELMILTYIVQDQELEMVGMSDLFAMNPAPQGHAADVWSN